jgi:hypothetical protein
MLPTILLNRFCNSTLPVGDPRFVLKMRRAGNNISLTGQVRQVFVTAWNVPYTYPALGVICESSRSALIGMPPTRIGHPATSDSFFRDRRL